MINNTNFLRYATIIAILTLSLHTYGGHEFSGASIMVTNNDTANQIKVLITGGDDGQTNGGHSKPATLDPSSMRPVSMPYLLYSKYVKQDPKCNDDGLFSAPCKYVKVMPCMYPYYKATVYSINKQGGSTVLCTGQWACIGTNQLYTANAPFTVSFAPSVTTQGCTGYGDRIVYGDGYVQQSAYSLQLSYTPPS